MEQNRPGARSAERPQRAVRGLAASAVATIVAAAAHTLAGGGAPAWWLLLTVTLLASPLAVWFVGRRPSLRGTAAAALTAQALLHLAFGTLGTASAPMSEPVGGLPHHGALALTSVPAIHLHLSPAMLVAHLAGAGLTILLLTRGEQLIRLIARGIRRLLSREPALRSAPAVHVPASGGATPAVDRYVLSAWSRRGPPAFAR